MKDHSFVNAMNYLLLNTVTVKFWFLYSNFFAATCANKEIANDSYPSKEISLVDNLWLQEIELWSFAIDSKLNNTIDHIYSDIDNLIQEENDNFTVYVHDFINTHQLNNTSIKDAISDIDCYWDGTLSKYVKQNSNSNLQIVNQYITKPVITNLILGNYKFLNDSVSQLNDKLVQFNETVRFEIEQIVDFNIENFEEWAETIITEWSQRMSQMDILQRDWSLDQWDHFLTMKRKILNFHQHLLTWSPNLERLDRILQSQQSEIDTFYKIQEKSLQDLQDQSTRQFQLRLKHS